MQYTNIEKISYICKNRIRTIMMHAIESMSNQVLSAVALLALLAYFFLTGFLVRKKPRLLWIPASL